MNEDIATDSPVFCARCSRELTPGRGDFYVIRIEAVADPSPPEIREEDLAGDHRREYERLVQRMSDLSAREALEQVHRRMTICLCGHCYRPWIENPAGQ